MPNTFVKFAFLFDSVFHNFKRFHKFLKSCKNCKTAAKSWILPPPPNLKSPTFRIFRIQTFSEISTWENCFKIFSKKSANPLTMKYIFGYLNTALKSFIEVTPNYKKTFKKMNSNTRISVAKTFRIIKALLKNLTMFNGFFRSRSYVGWFLHTFLSNAVIWKIPKHLGNFVFSFHIL